MGFLKKNIEKMKRDISAGKVKSEAIKADYQRKHWFVCPKCASTMKPVMVQLGGTFAKPKVKCEDCKFTMPLEDAKRELKHPE